MNKPNDTIVATEVVGLVNEWKSEMYDAGINYTNGLNRLQEINFAPNLGSAAYSSKAERIISIDEKYREADEMVLRIIIWHELGHYVLLMKHSDTGIMQPKLNDTQYYYDTWEGLKAHYINSYQKTLLFNGALEQYN